MWTPLTIKDVSKIPIKKLRKKGALIDFRWNQNMTEVKKVEILASFTRLLLKNSLVLSGFGEKSFRGILSSSNKDSQLNKSETSKLKKWRKDFVSELEYFQIGKIQWIDEIYYE